MIVTLLDFWQWIFRAVISQQRRSVLTIFGFSIGISAVILLNAIGESLRQYILQEFTQFGTHIIAVVPGKTETLGLSGILNTTRPLSLDDAKSLARLPAAEQVVPVVMGTAALKWDKYTRYSEVAGVSAAALNAWRLSLARGSFLPDDDLEQPRSLAVIGSVIKRELFGHQAAIGKKIAIGGQSFRIVGELNPKGEFMGLDLDDMVYVPVAKGLQLFNRESLMEIDIFYSHHVTGEAFKQQVRQRLIARHHSEDFTLITQDDMLITLDKILRYVKYATAGLGLISLLVGAVGIVTILTITVTERSHEIGLLRAIGFAPNQIRWLFLGESMLLALNSGVIGYLFSMSLLMLAKWQLPGIPIGFDLDVLVLAITVSILIGLIAGWRPAAQAAQLEPVDALRAE